MSATNTCHLIGYLTADPKRQQPRDPEKKSWVTARIGVRRSQEGSDFFELVAFESTGDRLAEWGSKGRLVAIAGRLRHEVWETDDGRPRSRVRIVVGAVQFLDRRPGEPDNDPRTPDEPAPEQADTGQTA